MKSKILIISWTVYPWPTGSSIIVNNFVKGFSQDEIVLVGEEHPTLASKENQIGHKIYYVNPNINIFGRGQTHLRWLTFKRIFSEIKAICLKEKVTEIFTIFPDDFYLILGYKLSKNLQIKFFTWFHNTYLDNYKGYRKLIAKIFQPKVFSQSHTIFVMSNGMNKFFSKKYPKYNFETLVHGFNIPNKGLNFSSINLSQKKLKFLFTGSLNESCRDATTRLIKTILKNPKFEVHAYTGNPESDFIIDGLNSVNFFYHGFIGLQDLYNEIENFDIMLLPHGLKGNRTDVEFKTIFPTRTIPLLSSGKPILCHSPANTFLTEFLKEANCAWVVTEPSEELITEEIISILNNPTLVKERCYNAFESASQFKLENVVKKFRKFI